MDRTTFLPMDDKHLGQFGENTARAFRPEGWMGGRPVWRLTLECLQRVTAVRDRVWRAEKSGAAEWLLDNWYLAQRSAIVGIQPDATWSSLDIKSAFTPDIPHSLKRASIGSSTSRKLK